MLQRDRTRGGSPAPPPGDFPLPQSDFSTTYISGDPACLAFEGRQMEPEGDVSHPHGILSYKRVGIGRVTG
ncbi:MAG: hypothetical protein OXF41_08440 [bacterium]|nr:hypothetical protein [bacterium]